MTATSQALGELFARDPLSRLGAAQRFAPPGCEELISSVKRDVFGWARNLKGEAPDPITDLPDWLHQKFNAWDLPSLYGTANAWLIFVGPSPGGSPTVDGRVDKLLGSSHRRNPVLGWPHPSFWYPDGPGFAVTIRRWATETIRGIAPDLAEDEALSCTLMLNLTSGQFANAGDVNIADSAAAARRFWQLLVPDVKPHLVVALTRNIYRQLRDWLPTEGSMNELPSVTVRMAKPWVQLQCVVRLQTAQRPILLATVPQHPSRRSFLGSNLSSLYDYLAQTARYALSVT